jgi:hypothetical protein
MDPHGSISALGLMTHMTHIYIYIAVRRANFKADQLAATEDLLRKESQACRDRDQPTGPMVVAAAAARLIIMPLLPLLLPSTPLLPPQLLPLVAAAAQQQHHTIA